TFAGFGWHQGWNDGSSVALHSEYEANLVDLIADVRSEYGAGLPVVVANTGMLNFPSLAESRPNVLAAQNRIGDPSLYPGFVGNVGVVDTTPFWRPPTESPADQVFHWHQNGVTMYQIGAGMGDAFLALTIPDSALAGDYNNDQLVNAADYTAWRDKLGAPAVTLRNTTSNGPIGAAEYATWLGSYAAPTVALAAIVPEPSTAVAAIAAAAIGGLFRDARRVRAPAPRSGPCCRRSGPSARRRHSAC
ncbi:MAG: hypothetical protein AAGG46_00005, partial [Planctomycetota bacterium]